MNAFLSRLVRRVRADRSGFSLIEVLVAMVVFSIGVLSLAICVPAGTRRINAAGQQTRASTLAARQAEELLMTPFGNSALAAGTHTYASNPVDSTYYVTWTVVDSVPVVGCKRVTVRVSRNSTTSRSIAAMTIVKPQF